LSSIDALRLSSSVDELAIRRDEDGSLGLVDNDQGDGGQETNDVHSHKEPHDRGVVELSRDDVDDGQARVLDGSHDSEGSGNLSGSDDQGNAGPQSAGHQREGQSDQDDGDQRVGQSQGHPDVARNDDHASQDDKVGSSSDLVEELAQEGRKNHRGQGDDTRVPGDFVLVPVHGGVVHVVDVGQEVVEDRDEGEDSSVVAEASDGDQPESGVKLGDGSKVELVLLGIDDSVREIFLGRLVHDGIDDHRDQRQEDQEGSDPEDPCESTEGGADGRCDQQGQKVSQTRDGEDETHGKG